MSSAYYPTGQDPMGKSFTGSLIAHGIVLALVATSGLFTLTKKHFGDPTASSGSVGVDIVKTIPIPRREGPTNPLANDSTSVVPQAPAPVKLQKQVKAPPEKAIEIPDKTVKPKKLSPKPQITDLLKPPTPYKDNQVFSHTPQGLNSPMYGMQGAGGIDVGKASILGDRYGAYANLIRDRIGQHWNRSNLHSLPNQVCTVTFTIQRNGSVTNVQISHPSGDFLLDTSAKRAILDSDPLPTLPSDFPRSEASVELNFQLNQ